MIEFIPFTEAHFLEYKKWFENDAIKNALGFIDEEWLSYILNDTTGIEYAVLQNNILLAVVGITYPDTKNKTYVINNIAVNPGYCGQAFGSLVLKELVLRHPAKENESWMAYVDVNNEPAQKFFIKNGWIEICENSDDDMLCLYFKAVKRD